MCLLDGNHLLGYPRIIRQLFKPGRFVMQAEAPVKAHDFAVTRKLQWLALSLTPGVGAGRGRKLVEYFGGIDRLFTASLTELEAAGLPIAAAQSLALARI